MVLMVRRRSLTPDINRDLNWKHGLRVYEMVSPYDRFSSYPDNYPRQFIKSSNLVMDTSSLQVIPHEDFPLEEWMTYAPEHRTMQLFEQWVKDRVGVYFQWGKEYVILAYESRIRNRRHGVRKKRGWFRNRRKRRQRVKRWRRLVSIARIGLPNYGVIEWKSQGGVLKGRSNFQPQYRDPDREPRQKYLILKWLRP